jgi:hypothetical protein
MKIDRVSPQQGAASGVRAMRSVGGFVLPADDVAPQSGPRPLAAPAGIANVGAMLALQGVAAPEADRRRRAVKRADSLLDGLDALKLDVLAGRLDLGRLRRLGTDLAHREPSDDPRLEAIVAEIELRAAVELAKAERWAE